MSDVTVDVLTVRASDTVVLEAFGRFVRHGREIVPAYNTPRSTGLVANAVRGLARAYGDTSTAIVLRILRAAESAGFVECVGTGREHNRAYNKSAASERELYWRLTDAGLARIGGAA